MRRPTGTATLLSFVGSRDPRNADGADGPLLWLLRARRWRPAQRGRRRGADPACKVAAVEAAETDARGRQKEVCDFLLVLRGNAILASMKCQADPSSRGGDKLRRWTIKNAEKAVNQARGALKTIAREPFWCQHWRRGRVDFKQGSVRVAHAVVLTEVFGEAVELPQELPLLLDGVPVTYLSVSDFLKLIEELRAFPDIAGYFHARRTLPDGCLRLVGHEALLYRYYVLNTESFAGCDGHAHARISRSARDAEWRSVLDAGQSRHEFASMVECVSDALAARLKDFSEGLDAQTIARFDPPDDRRSYLLMQEELCDLRLAERSALGRQFVGVMDKVEKNAGAENMAYGAFWTDSKPDLVYVLVAARGVERAVLLGRLPVLLRAAMAACGRNRGLAIADRDGAGFEVLLISGRSGDPNDEELGKAYFAKLRVSHTPSLLRQARAA